MNDIDHTARKFSDLAEPPSQDPAPAAIESQLDPQVPSSAGRRRGRRKTMIKKMIKDEEGYLGQSRECISKLAGFYANRYSQSRGKSFPGSPSPRMNPQPRNPRLTSRTLP